MSESKTSARRTSGAQRRREALRLRIAGMSFSEIGAELQISRQAAGRHVQKALKELAADVREESEILQALMAERLEHMVRVLWPKAERGDLAAVDRLLKVFQRQAALFGLDAPTRTALTDPSGTKEFSGGGMSALLKRIREAQQREDHEHDLSPKED